MIEQDFNIDGIVWSLVGKFIERNRIDKHLNSTAEDIFSEARLAALIAITKFDATKKATMTTWVYNCVDHYLQDLGEKEVGRMSLADMVHLEQNELEEIEDRNRHDDNFEFIMSMKKVLSKDNYKFFVLRFLEDKSITELVNEGVITRKRARKCMESVVHAYSVLHGYRLKVRTQISLQKEWANV